MNLKTAMQSGAQLLPPAARDALRRAADTPVPRDDPLARVKAIEKCLERLRRQYPQHFRRQE